MRPPEFHIPLQFQMRFVQGIHKVIDSTIFTVSSEIQDSFDDIRGTGNKCSIIFLLRMLQHKPHGFQSMTGVDHAPFGGFQIKWGSLIIDIFKKDPHLRIPETFGHSMNRLFCGFIIFMAAKTSPHFISQIRKHHEMTM